MTLLEWLSRLRRTTTPVPERRTAVGAGARAHGAGLVDGRGFAHRLALRCVDGGEADGDVEPLGSDRRI